MTIGIADHLPRKSPVKETNTLYCFLSRDTSVQLHTGTYQGTDEAGSTVRQALREAPALGERTGTYQGAGEAGPTVRQALREAPGAWRAHRHVPGRG